MYVDLKRNVNTKETFSLINEMLVCMHHQRFKMHFTHRPIFVLKKYNVVFFSRASRRAGWNLDELR